MAYEKERQELIKAYCSNRWAYKVTHMSDEQVIAIYLRFKAQGKI